MCTGHQIYQQDFPNGDMVPDPCTLDTSDVWTRVGHDIEDPRTCIDKERDQKNSFGLVSKIYNLMSKIFLLMQDLSATGRRIRLK